MQLVTSANSIWPTPTPAPSVAYAQVGDLVELLLHPKDSVFATCGFCQTLNRRGATRCRACGGSFVPSDDEALDSDNDEPGADATQGSKDLEKPQFSDLPALRSVLLLVVVPPMLMFLGFGAWSKLRLSDHEPVSLPNRSSIESVFTVPNTSAVAEVRIDEPKVRHAPPKPEPIATDDKQSIAAVEDDEHDQKILPSRNKPISSLHQSTRIQQGGSPLAACSGYSFIARAVCVNKSCAQPRAAQHAECKQANRQRRIDENRRNPVLMG